ncbi:hypothetical protein BSY18_4148 (plasmid) [Blastomonas sp. RAC04]|nr:hypothetical protein BSY18_4148 [Blastomonas sp. RAC04]
MFSARAIGVTSATKTAPAAIFAMIVLAISTVPLEAFTSWSMSGRSASSTSGSSAMAAIASSSAPLTK